MRKLGQTRKSSGSPLLPRATIKIDFRDGNEVLNFVDLKKVFKNLNYPTQDFEAKQSLGSSLGSAFLKALQFKPASSSDASPCLIFALMSCFYGGRVPSGVINLHRATSIIHSIDSRSSVFRMAADNKRGL